MSNIYRKSMKKFTFLLSFCFVLVTSNLNAQQERLSPNLRAVEARISSGNSDTFSLGIGGGFDFGGFGGSLLVYPGKNLGLFGGVGYALAGVGYNFGIKYRIVSKKESANTIPYFIAMYGYNAAIGIKDMEQLNRLFYGPSVGFGFDFRSRALSDGYWTLSLNYPFRSTEVDAYITHLKRDLYIKFDNKLLPVTMSIGYRFILNRKIDKR